MRFVEASGKTKDEAITNAIIELGVPEEQVDIEVISEGSKGLFGLFSKAVKIRATLKEDADDVAPKREAKPAKKAETKAEAKDETVKQEEGKEEAHSIEVEGLTVTGEKVIINDTIEQRLRKANANKKNDGDNNHRERRRNDRPSRYNREENAQKDEEIVVAPVVHEPKVYEIPEDAEEVTAKTCSFLKDLLGNMGIEAEVTGKFSEEGILEIDIAGEGMGLIIGKRGATLDSLQYLATLVINKDRKDHVRMKLDTEGYRSRRQETLEKLAVNMAKKAKRTGHRVVLEPMNPYERRIIHATLQAEPGVETHSDGEEPYRKVIISPKRRRG